MSNLADALGRRARYLRLSITDRCNFRCNYCTTGKREHIPHAEILRYEEFLRLARVASRLGVEKIRVTGGEPFARQDCAAFLSGLRSELPAMRICVTTNGSLLEPYIADLARIRPGSLNISLDTFNRETFLAITGRDELPTVLANIERLLCAGIRVKLNAVAMRGITDVQFDDFMHAVRTLPLDVRFIEFMPMGHATSWSSDKFLPAARLLEMARERFELNEEPAPKAANSGPARMFSIPGARGRLGFISPLSQHFCHACNRLRITSAGRLRLCLFSDRDYRLAGMLRHKKITDNHIAEVFQRAILHKPFGADILKARQGQAVAHAAMSGIGG